MAKVLGPFYSLGVSGRIGDGYVMSSWRGIPYARQFVMPANRHTKRWEEVKALFARQNKRWATLTEEERQAWREFCKQRGILSPASGMFASYSFVAVDAGLPEPVLPPGSSKPFPQELSLKLVGKSLVVSWSPPRLASHSLRLASLLDLWMWSGRVSLCPHPRQLRHLVYVPLKDKSFILKDIRSNRKYAFRARVILPDSNRSKFSSASLIVE